MTPDEFVKLTDAEHLSTARKLADALCIVLSRDPILWRKADEIRTVLGIGAYDNLGLALRAELHNKYHATKT